MLMEKNETNTTHKTTETKQKQREVKESLHAGSKCCRKVDRISDFKVTFAHCVYPSLSFIFNFFLFCLTVLVLLIYLGEIFRFIL